MPSRPLDLIAAMAVARLRAVRIGLLALHQALLTAERQRYERRHGRIAGPQQALQLVLDDPWFAWLRPMATLIVQIDERMADDDTALTPEQVDSYLQEVRGLLQGQLGGEAFVTEYHRSLQERPEVVVAHGQVTALLNGPPPS
jgi:hypothetical protein